MELLPCPFCGLKDIKYVNRKTCVMCNKCGSVVLTENWNTRPSSPKEWCPTATMELSKCQKAFNEIQEKYNNLLKNNFQLISFIKEINHHKNNGHKHLSIIWILNEIEKFMPIPSLPEEK